MLQRMRIRPPPWLSQQQDGQLGAQRPSAGQTVLASWQKAGWNDLQCSKKAKSESTVQGAAKIGT